MIVSPVISLFFFTVRQTLSRRSIWLTVLLLLLPTVLTMLVRHFDPQPSPNDVAERFLVPSQFLLLMLAVPLCCLLHGSTLIGAEVEHRTLTYLITRRLDRGTVLLVRFVAVALLLSALVAGALALQYFVAMRGVSDAMIVNWDPAAALGACLRIIPLMVSAYLAIFTLIGLISARPMTISAFYLILVELVMGNLPLGIQQYSVLHLSRRTLLTEIPALRRLFDYPGEAMELLFPEGARGDVALMAVIAGGLILGMLLMSNRELVPSRLARE